MKRTTMILFVLGFLTVTAAAQRPKYGVSATFDRKTDFSALKSYVWRPGWPATDKAVHAQIMAAIDRQMSGVGFEKREREPADVAIYYASVRRTDVDLSSDMDEATKLRREYPVGTLVVLMKDPQSGKEFFRGRADKILQLDPAGLNAVIESAVTEIFEKYPARISK